VKSDLNNLARAGVGPHKTPSQRFLPGGSISLRPEQNKRCAPYKHSIFPLTPWFTMAHRMWAP